MYVVILNIHTRVHVVSVSVCVLVCGFVPVVSCCLVLRCLSAFEIQCTSHVALIRRLCVPGVVGDAAGTAGEVRRSKASKTLRCSPIT